jgi:AraC family transcriptional regulator, transcriptional activator of pobA
MSKTKQPSAEQGIPYFTELASFYKHVKARPPLNNDFDIRKIDPEVLKGYDYVAKPFRHSFYCIALFLQGNITLNTGFWKARLKKPCLYLKTPCQVVSWAKPPSWLDEYFIVFTENFILKYKTLAEIIFQLPFFRLEKAIPFEIEPDELKLLTNLYDQIMKEYKSDNADKFDLISSYTYSLLIHVRRLYNKYVKTDDVLTSHIHDNERMLVEKFRSLIRKKIATGETTGQHLTVRHVAGLLSTHPNHLNAVVKRQKQKTAIAFLHEQIFYEAQSLLGQTELNLKEISFRLGFADTSHFNHFFKKQSGKTPAAYRKEKSQ